MVNKSSLPRPLTDRIRLVRYILPVVLIPIVVLYQLQIAFRLEETYGHPVHYAAEISFYSLVGPVVTWITLIWVERRLAEKEDLERQVRARTHQLASLTEASPDAILSLDLRGRITSWNKGATRLFGYSESEITGRPFEELLPDSEHFNAALHGAGFLQNFETTALTRDGQRVRVDLTQTYLRGQENDAPVSLLIMRDITVRSERAAILEEERGRIARDLHDGVAQTLYFLALKADMARGQLSANVEEARTNLAEIGQEARRAIREVRQAIFGLKPLDWSEGGFIAALRRFVEDFAEQAGWQANIKIHVDEQMIPPRLEPAIFRLAQESLNNVAKHAGAQKVRVELSQHPSPTRLVLMIQDDGAGFELESANHGLGLKQMEKRVVGAGGSFTVQSQPGRGTHIHAEIPFVMQGATNG